MFPYIRSWSNFWMCGMGYASFWYTVFAVYCLYYQYRKIQIYKLRRKRIQMKDDTLLLNTKPSSLHYLNKVIQIPYTSEMISIQLVLFTILFSLVNFYFAVFFCPYEEYRYHPGVIDRRAAFTGMVDWSIVFFMIQRNSILPTMCGLSFEELIPHHRIISRIGIINFLPHLIYRMYWGYLEQGRYWDMFFKDIEYTTGTIAMWGCLAILFSSFEYIRRYHFKVFYYSHIVFAIVTILGTLFHYPTCFVFFLPAVFAWLSDRVTRTWKSWFVPSSFVHVDQVAAQTETQEGIVRIMVENRLLSSFYPGQYVFVAMIIDNSFWEHWHWHPFTISEIFHVPKKTKETSTSLCDDIESQELLSTPTSNYQSMVITKDKANQLRRRHQSFADDKKRSFATIHIKALGKKTRQLLDSLNNNEKGSKVRIYIDGLYGPRLPYQDYRVLGLFATGIGVTPALVIVKDVIDKRYQNIYSMSVSEIHLIWSIRHTDEILPFLDLFEDWLYKVNHSSLPIQLKVTIYATRMTMKQQELPFQCYYGKRPHIKTEMDKIQKENSSSSVWTHVCGPMSFTREVINEAVDHQFQVHHETFEF